MIGRYGREFPPCLEEMGRSYPWCRYHCMADSDGYIGDLHPRMDRGGINFCDPIVAAHSDIADFRRRFGRDMAFVGGVDKRALARGSTKPSKIN